VSDEIRNNLIKYLTKKEVISESSEIINSKKIYSKIPEKIYEAILKKSDNLIAESLLANVGYTYTDTISVDYGIDKTLEKLRPEIQNGIEWFDGSGLSRYNMVKSQTIIYALNEIYNHWGLEKITKIFPNNYIIEGKDDFVWGKTGTLKNNHNYSGFIKSRKGKYYLFSIMINHFNSDLADVKQSIKDFLLYVNTNG
jgi:D-alanyl-D-alanine carboxypeptidase/D-alanyl-D-alanine-endopeptidase (penicillin-binding protein 4)